MILEVKRTGEENNRLLKAMQANQTDELQPKKVLKIDSEEELQEFLSTLPQCRSNYVSKRGQKLTQLDISSFDDIDDIKVNRFDYYIRKLNLFTLAAFITSLLHQFS